MDEQLYSLQIRFLPFPQQEQLELKFVITFWFLISRFAENSGCSWMSNLTSRKYNFCNYFLVAHFRSTKKCAVMDEQPDSR